MIKLNRTNYEEYFLLYTDKELSAAERRIVEDFVRQNPDLANELVMLQQSRMKPEKDVVFRNKEALMQFDETAIHTGNYEEHFLLYADNELSNRQKAMVEQFVYDHPQYQSAFELFHEIRLTPDRSLLFPHKERLYRHEKVRPLVNGWWKPAAAAMVLLVAGMLWLNQQNVQPANQVVKNTKRTEPLPRPTVKQADQPDLPAKNERSSLDIDSKFVALQNGKADEKRTSRSKKNDVAVNTPTEIKQEKREEPVHPINDNLAGIGKEFDIQQTAKTNTDLLVHQIDASLANNMGKTRLDEPAIKTDEGSNSNIDPDDIRFASNNAENVVLGSIPIDNKHSLRSIFRKASRLINRGSSLGAGPKKGILIGNVELAFQ